MLWLNINTYTVR